MLCAAVLSGGSSFLSRFPDMTTNRHKSHQEEKDHDNTQTTLGGNVVTLLGKLSTVARRTSLWRDGSALQQLSDSVTALGVVGELARA